MHKIYTNVRKISTSTLYFGVEQLKVRKNNDNDNEDNNKKTHFEMTVAVCVTRKLIVY